jgi:hypothetical protein
MDDEIIQLLFSDKFNTMKQRTRALKKFFFNLVLKIPMR